MPRRETLNQRRIRELTQDNYGDLPWLDLPTTHGWYWYRVVPSTAVRGPVHVEQQGKTLISQAGDEARSKPVQTFQRQWAGPLPRPVEPQP